MTRSEAGAYRLTITVGNAALVAVVVVVVLVSPFRLSAAAAATPSAPAAEPGAVVQAAEDPVRIFHFSMCGAVADRALNWHSAASPSDEVQPHYGETPDD